MSLILFLKKEEKKQNIIKIDVESRIDSNKSPIDLSDFIESVTYCPLETRSDNLIGANPEYIITDKEIVVRTFSDCYIFKRETGEFLRKIGKNGKGPREYRKTSGFVNPYCKELFFIGWKGNLLKYNMDGTFLKSILIPEYVNSVEVPSFPTNFTWLKNNIVLYFSNMTGSEKKLLMIIDEEGEILASHPNNNYYNKPKGMISMNLEESQFYHFNQDLYFKEDYSDTVFKISGSEMIPKMILFLGRYQPSYKLKSMTSQKRKELKYQPIGLRNLIETNSFLFFEYHYQRKLYQGIYNKNTDRLRITNKENGINNDIDGFISFSPISITSDGYLVGVIEAYKLLLWFYENSEKALELPLHIQKLKNIKDTDNPVIMIAKLKE
jgi:hypothetical protein